MYLVLITPIQICGMLSAFKAIPFSPPVKLKKLRLTITCPASPNANVTIANVIPVVRSDAAPTNAASTTLTKIAITAANHQETTL